MICKGKAALFASCCKSSSTSGSGIIRSDVLSSRRLMWCLVPLSPIYRSIPRGYLSIFLVYWGMLPKIGWERWKQKGWANHALCNQGVVALDEHHTLADCVRVDLNPYTYVCMQQCVPRTCIPHICRSTQLHIYIHIHLLDIKTDIYTEIYVNAAPTWVKH